jgi:MarR family transcriptional repressor of emrRAB
MNIESLTEAYKSGRDNQQRAIFASLFILGNRLQTSFDKVDPVITVKQFMVLIMVKQVPEKSLGFDQLRGASGMFKTKYQKAGGCLGKERTNHDQSK